MKNITGIHHVALICRDMKNYEETLCFYRDLLGLEVAREWDGGRSVMLDTGAGIMEIFAEGGEPAEEGALRHIAFTARDTDALIEAVRGAGYKVTMEPTDIVIASEVPYPARIAFCIGPVGETVEFFCVK